MGYEDMGRLYYGLPPLFWYYLKYRETIPPKNDKNAIGNNEACMCVLPRRVGSVLVAGVTIEGVTGKVEGALCSGAWGEGAVVEYTYVLLLLPGIP